MSDQRVYADLSQLRVLFFGLYGRFSLLPMRAFLHAGVNICGVVIPPAEALPAESIVSEAAANQIPVHILPSVRSETAVSTIRSLAPDVAVVACYSQKIPPQLRQIPRFGFLNLHPSLLPQFRGPEPLFWTFRTGQLATGVTVHRMDDGMDTGDIVLQRPLILAAGMSGAEAEATCATVGGEMLVEVLRKLVAKAALSKTQFPLALRPQSKAGSHAPFPTPFDFGLDIKGSAERAFLFMRGTAEWQMPYRLEADSGVWWLKTAVLHRAVQGQKTAVVQAGDLVTIQFAHGQLVACRAD